MDMAVFEHARVLNTGPWVERFTLGVDALLTLGALQAKLRTRFCVCTSIPVSATRGLRSLLSQNVALNLKLKYSVI